MNNNEKTNYGECPYCGDSITQHPALSRLDNKTKICPDCGTIEALMSLLHESARLAEQPISRVVTTQGAAEFPPAFLASCLERHASRDWGDLDAEDKRANDAAVKHGGRVLSAYTLRGDKIWIITEADRSVTTILTPDEY